MTVCRAALVLSLCMGVATGAEPSRIDDVPPPADLGQTWVEINGQVYGAKPDELGPIGGGEGYQRIVTDGDYRVSTADELRDALAKVQSGAIIYVEEDADIDCTSLVFAEDLAFEIPEGVTLAGNRGANGSRGAVIYSDALATNPLIRAAGPNVRITGLRIRGPDPKRRLDHHRRAYADPAKKDDRKAQSKYYYSLPCSNGICTEHSGLEVDNCELSGWSHAAIYLPSGKDHHIHHSYIHHNQRAGLGYGVSLGYGSESVALIEYNLFNYNRHSIAATGKPGNAYEARHNVEIEHSLSHMFDMHGGRDRRDGTDIAGDWLKIHHNTFRCTQVRAVAIRGVPAQQAEIYGNWFFHDKPGGLVISPWPTGGETHIDCHDNAYGREKPAIVDPGN